MKLVGATGYVRTTTVASRVVPVTGLPTAPRNTYSVLGDRESTQHIGDRRTANCNASVTLQQQQLLLEVLSRVLYFYQIQILSPQQQCISFTLCCS